MRWRFIHASDLHLDTPFDGVARVNDDLAAVLREASLAAFDRLVELALSDGAAVVVLAGDIYDGEERGVRAQIRFARGLRKLDDAGIRTFVVHGNHDPVGSGWSAIRGNWPELVKIYGSSHVESVPVDFEGERIATVHGISYATREESRNLALGFSRSGGDELQIGLLHCNVGSNAEHAAYAPCSVHDLVETGIDYWALGHVHRRQIIEEGDPWIVYPGNTQARSPKPAEHGAKGAFVVEVDGNAVTELRFVALDSVRFDNVEIDIGGYGDIVDLQDALLGEAARLVEEAEGRTLILRASLTGSGPAHQDMVRQDAAEEILESLRGESESSLPGVWWDRLEDLTLPPIDIDSLRGRGDFAGELILFADELRNDQTRWADVVKDLQSRLRVEELRRLGIQSASLSSDVLDRAVRLALGELLDGGGA